MRFNEGRINMEKKVEGLTKEEKAEAKKLLKNKAMEEIGVKDEDIAKFNEMCKLAGLPIVVKDKDIKLVKGEIDVRQLSQANIMQLLFRNMVVGGAYLKDIRDSLVDIQKLLMIILKQMGVEEIIKATDEIVEELQKEVSSANRKLN